MAYLLKKRRSALPTPEEKGKDDHGHLPPFLSEELCRWPWPMPSSSREEVVWPSSSKRERSVTIAIFLPFFRRELWRWPMPSSSREEEVCLSGPKKESVMAMVISFLSPSREMWR